MSEHNAQQNASSQQAQGVVNVAPDEKKPTQVTYDDFMKQLTDLEKQINDSGASAADVEALKQKVADLESEVAKRATKKGLAKKISDLQKQLQDDGGDDDGQQGEAEAEAAKAEAEAKRRAGRGIVAVDQLQTDALGNYKWFNDLLKAHKKLVGFQ